MEEGTPNQPLVSAPIVPTLPEIENSANPFNSLNTPAPYIREFGSLMPPVPNGIPDAININKQLQGDFNTGPNPGAKASNHKKNTLDYVKAVTDYIGDPNAVRDRFKYGRTYSYGAGYKNMNFDRYYNHPEFKKLGFNPYRDNDAHYNERSSWWDDFSRMRGEWGSLAWSGFKSIWGDENEANEAMEKGMAIGTSTKDGFGAKVTNFGLNSAYTVGVMAEIALEDLALLAIEYGSGLTATPEVVAAGAARNSMAFGRLTKAWEGVSKTMKAMSHGDVKTFWEASKGFAGAINPLTHSTDFIKDVYHGSGGMKHMSDIAKVSKGFGSFYRDFREMNVAHSEAALEGAGASSKYQEQMIDEFYAEHGRMPEGKETDEIFERAQSIKASVTLANDVAIFYSNKLVFDDLFKGFQPGSAVADAFLKGSGRGLKRAAAKGYKAGANIVEAEMKSGLKKTRDFLLKSRYVPWSKKYFLGNLGEALQENAQEAIQVGAKDYYDKIHSDPTQVGYYSILASIGKGTAEQFSGQGLETFLSGYLMGSLIQGGSGAVIGGFNKVTGKAKTAKEQAEKTDNDIMNAANHVGRNSMVYGDQNVNTASALNALNKERTAKTEEGDEKTARDMSDELQISYFTKLAKTKNMGLVIGHVDDMLELSDKDLAESYGVSENEVGKVREKLNTLKSRAEGFQERYDALHKAYPNTANPWMFDPKKNPEAYAAEMEAHQVHEAVLEDMVFAHEDYARIAERMTEIGKDLSGQTTRLNRIINVFKGGSAVANADASDVSLLIDPIDAKGTLQGLKDQISVMKQGTPQQQREALKLEKHHDNIKDWFMAVDDYKRQLTSSQKEGATDTVQESIDRLYKAYDKYMRNVASDKQGRIFDKDLQEGFKKIKDFYALEHDAAGMVSTINALSNPRYLARYKEIQANIQKMKQEQRLAKLQEALDAFNKMKGDNKFLNALYDLGVFVFPEDVDNLSRFEVVDFYDVASKDLVKPGTEKYNKIMDLMDQYSEGKTTGKETPEQGTTPEAKAQSKYNSEGRPKLANDKRTYKDLAEQFGFDPKSAKSTVKTEEVLRSIITSKYATAAEKALARRLLSTVKPDSVITFVNNNSTPGHYAHGGGTASTETVIDARYMSADYKNGNKRVMEHVILHEYLHELSVEGINTDAEFKGALTKLNEAVKAYQQTKEGQDKFGSKPLYGTMNEKEFVTEALTNPVFQAMLREVPYESTGKASDAWTEFTDTVRKFFRRLLGVNNTNTALDEAMHIISVKLDNTKPAETSKPGATVSAGATRLGPNEKVTNATPIALLRTSTEGAKLATDLIYAYHNYLVEQELPPAKGTEDEIVASEEFQTFMRETGTAGAIIEAFNKAREPKGPQPVAPKKVTANIWAVGNRKLFTGTIGGVKYDQIPIEIEEYNEYFDNDAGENVREVMAKNLETNEIIFINLGSPDAASFKYPELTVAPTDVQKDITPAEEKVEDGTVLGNHHGIEIVEDSKIRNAVGQPGAAQLNRTDGKIHINTPLLRQKYAEKAWTKPTTQSDGSKSKPLSPTLFPTYESFEQFVIEHEYQHKDAPFGSFQAANPNGTKGQYEDYINDKALLATGAMETVEESSDLVEEYNNITNKSELDAWVEKITDAMYSPAKKAELGELFNLTFNSENVNKLIADKEKGLAMNVNFDSLTLGKVVVMKDNRKMVVKDITPTDVVLVSTTAYKTNDPTAKTITIAKGVIKDQVKMVHGDFIHKAEKEVGPTAEEIQDSNKALEEAAKDLSEQIKEDTEKAKTMTAADARKALLDQIQKCKKQG